MSRTLLTFNTYKITPAIISEFEKMQKSGLDCVLVVNNEYGIIDSKTSVIEKEFFGVKAKCLLVHLCDIENLKLHVIEDIGKGGLLGSNIWYNTDYLAYFVRHHFSDYDFYWSIDYDCYLNASDYKEFIEFYDREDTDFIASWFRKERSDSGWYWIECVDWAYDNDECYYGCVFGIVRYSGRALDVLYKRRVELGEVFRDSKKEDKRWHFCEFFCATETILNGFSARSFTDDGHKITAFDLLDFNINRVFTHYDNKVYHPVKEDLLDMKIKELYYSNLGRAINNANGILDYMTLPFYLRHVVKSQDFVNSKNDYTLGESIAREVKKYGGGGGGSVLY